MTSCGNLPNLHRRSLVMSFGRGSGPPATQLEPLDAYWPVADEGQGGPALIQMCAPLRTQSTVRFSGVRSRGKSTGGTDPFQPHAATSRRWLSAAPPTDPTPSNGSWLCPLDPEPCVGILLVVFVLSCVVPGQPETQRWWREAGLSAVPSPERSGASSIQRAAHSAYRERSAFTHNLRASASRVSQVNHRQQTEEDKPIEDFLFFNFILATEWGM